MCDETTPNVNVEFATTTYKNSDRRHQRQIVKIDWANVCCHQHLAVIFTLFFSVARRNGLKNGLIDILFRYATYIGKEEFVFNFTLFHIQHAHCQRCSCILFVEWNPNESSLA